MTKKHCDLTASRKHYLPKPVDSPFYLYFGREGEKRQRSFLEQVWNFEIDTKYLEQGAQVLNMRAPCLEDRIVTISAVCWTLGRVPYERDSHNFQLVDKKNTALCPTHIRAPCSGSRNQRRKQNVSCAQKGTRALTALLLCPSIPAELWALRRPCKMADSHLWPRTPDCQMINIC